MKLGWATPLHHASAIGRFSVGVAEALSKREIQIEFLRTERIDQLQESRLPTALKVCDLARMSDLSALLDYDLLVYNIGDNALLHQHAVDALLRFPGICIFHDFVIANLFRGWVAGRGEESRASVTFDRFDGHGAYSRFAAPGRSSRQPGEYTMLEWLAPHALAAVAHGSHYRSQLEACCSGPVRHIPLAYDLPDEIAPPCRRNPEHRLRLATIGVVNENKLAAEIISVIGRSDRLRRSCSYTLAGPISDDMRRRLDHLASRLGVKLIIMGAVSRAELAAEIGKADALLCLRQPVLEGASASAIEAMLAGRPTLVLDHGFYRDLPADLVLKIPADFDDLNQTLAERLVWLLDHPEDACELGANAASWARRAFSFDAYADAFIPLMGKAFDAEPLMRLSLQLGQELSSLGADAEGPEAPRVAQIATDLFCPGVPLCPRS